MSDLLAKVSARYVKPKFTDVKSGDTVRVYTRIKEGDKERTQFFEGVVIRRRGGIGTGASFTVRRIASGVGVERTFPLHSPTIERIQIQRGAKVRRAQLHYLRGRTGKAARLTEQPAKQADRDREHPWPKRFHVEHKEMKAVEEAATEAQLKAEEAEATEAPAEPKNAAAAKNASEKKPSEKTGAADAATDDGKGKEKGDAQSEAKGDPKAAKAGKTEVAPQAPDKKPGSKQPESDANQADQEKKTSKD